MSAGETKGLTDNFRDWEDERKAKKLTTAFHNALKKCRDKGTKKKQDALEEKGMVLGINWIGIEYFFRLTGVVGSSEPCREEMQWVVERICKPVCDEKECELLELFKGVKVGTVPIVGEMNAFHSYTWKEAVQDTLRSVRTGVIMENEMNDVYFWWDLFCQNQHHVKNVIETFDAAVNQCSLLAMTIPNPAEPVALRRIWCLFEVMTAHSAGKQIKIMCNPTVKIQNADTSVDVRNAQATVKEDISMILGLVEERVAGGYNELNETIRNILVKGMTQAIVVRGAATGGAGRFDQNSEVARWGGKHLKEQVLREITDNQNEYSETEELLQSNQNSTLMPPSSPTPDFAMGEELNFQQAPLLPLDQENLYQQAPLISESEPRSALPKSTLSTRVYQKLKSTIDGMKRYKFRRTRKKPEPEPDGLGYSHMHARKTAAFHDAEMI